MKRTCIGMTREVERRESNKQLTQPVGSIYTSTLYHVEIVRVFVFWVPIWRHENRWHHD